MVRKTKREKKGGKSPGHSHRFTIADDEAVRTLVEKLTRLTGGGNEKREKLLRALDEAAGHYKRADRRQRQAFLHGLLTGYGVALKLKLH